MKRWTTPYFAGTDFADRKIKDIDGQRFVEHQMHTFATLDEALAWFNAGIERTLTLEYRCPHCGDTGIMCELCSQESAIEMAKWKQDAGITESIA